MRIAVIGLGKIGLPLAVQYALKGHAVTGVDINPFIVDSVNKAIAPYPEEADLDDYLSDVVIGGNLAATLDGQGAIAESDVVVVAVPLLVDASGNPDFTAVDQAATVIGRGLKSRTLVSFETTLPVGTTRRRLTPIMERESGLEVGVDFSVVFSPERVFTGQVFKDLRRYPKIVGGVTPRCEVFGQQFYEAVLDFDHRSDLSRPNGVWALGSSEAAELAKLAETTYRDINIAFANQLALHAETLGIDVHDVIRACNSQPFSHIHQPGVSVGGHCIPVYPRLYLLGDPQAHIVRDARVLNESMPSAAVERLVDTIGPLKGLTVVILGVTYRPGVKEAAFSGAFALAEALRDRGASIEVHDPLFSHGELAGMGFQGYSPGNPVDVAILHTAHSDYQTWQSSHIPDVKVILDGRNVLDPRSWPGTRIVTLGRGSNNNIS